MAFFLSLALFLSALAGIGYPEDESDSVQEGYDSESSMKYYENAPEAPRMHPTNLNSLASSTRTTPGPLTNLGSYSNHPSSGTKDFWPSVFFSDNQNSFDDSSDFDSDFDVGLDDTGRPFALRVHLPSNEFDLQYAAPYVAYNRRGRQREGGYGKGF